jgi:hypothetical protein
MGEGCGDILSPPYKGMVIAYTNRMSPLQILQHNDITPEDLLHQLKAKADHIPFVLKDDKDNTCFFILRRRGRLFLMAKLSTMTAYEDIYSVSGYE